ncbi:hypothetical protein D3C77_448620 [compost metagenome]
MIGTGVLAHDGFASVSVSELILAVQPPFGECGTHRVLAVTGKLLTLAVYASIVVVAVVEFVDVGIDALLGIVNSRHIAPLFVVNRKNFTQPQWAGNGRDNIALCLGQ